MFAPPVAAVESGVVASSRTASRVKCDKTFSQNRTIEAQLPSIEYDAIANNGQYRQYYYQVDSVSAGDAKFAKPALTRLYGLTIDNGTETAIFCAPNLQQVKRSQFMALDSAEKEMLCNEPITTLEVILARADPEYAARPRLGAFQQPPAAATRRDDDFDRTPKPQRTSSANPPVNNEPAEEKVWTPSPNGGHNAHDPDAQYPPLVDPVPLRMVNDRDILIASLCAAGGIGAATLGTYLYARSNFVTAPVPPGIQAAYYAAAG